MDADRLKPKWVQFKGALQARWSRFRDQHLVLCEAGYDQVVDKAHERYPDKKHELRTGADQRPQQSAPEALGEMPP